MTRRYYFRRLVRREWPRIVLAARGTVAALAALVVAIFLHLECPYWAAMTALIVIQPTRGLLLEKSFFRLIGTATGSVAGVAMLLTATSPAMLTLLLALWLALCVGIGNLLYGLRSYGALIGGCTGAVIAMSGYNNSSHLHDLVFGRVACIIVGIVVSTTVTLFFTHRNSKRELLFRLAKVAVADLEWVALLLRGGSKEDLNALRQDIFVEIADIEGTMDAAWAGSFDLKRRKRRIRNLIVSLLSLLEAGKLAGDYLTLQGAHQAPWREELARHLEEMARQLEQHKSTKQATARLTAFLAEARPHLPLLGEAMGELVNALQLVIDEWDNTTTHGPERPATNLYIRNRDWLEAGRAALRAACAIGAVGVLWQATGWAEGPLMMMAASLMVSIFSTHDRPAVLLTYIFAGAVTGVAAAFLCRLVILPGTSAPFVQVAVSIPFLMAGAIALYHRRTAMGAMDAMLFFLFVMQPGLPAVPPPTAYVAGGCAALGGIGVAILSFRFLLPIDPARRLRSFLSAIVSDLIVMAATDSLATVDNRRARTHHRVLGMLANARKLNNDLSAIVDGGLAALAIARCLQRLRTDEMGEGIPLVASGAIRETMLQLSSAIRRPEEILTVLESTAITLCSVMKPHLDTFTPKTPTPDRPRNLQLDEVFVARKKGLSPT
ncbi:FUSC family protein [Geobacter sp. FeAm09]|uniref:FUSC family protein n=1 Tax=Geobacter sp. FeAm09 TaxID=2597769 RepID=UPI0011EEA404|nr:FUSC family protein [Geobacter sp. FeAm09]QEM67727.1 FUSC family protein [Geobacter sp. FeAm09]